MLINVCCAPCTLPIIDHLQRRENIALYFFGPNIYPETEYWKRLNETRKIAVLYDLPLFEGGYDHAAWLSVIAGELPQVPESYPENGERCLACYRYRLAATAKFAKAKGFDSFAATLSISRFKDVACINQVGQALAQEFGLKYETFALDAGEAHRCGLELSKKHGIYRQKYCGCEFSLPKGSLPK